MSDNTEVLNAMVGLTMVEITDLRVGAGSVEFRSACGRLFVMHHVQDCCESVELNEVVGEVSHLIGSPLLQATESTNEGQNDDGTFTWTFYTLATARGYVTLRWLGESNGYYSERITVAEVPA